MSQDESYASNKPLVHPAPYGSAMEGQTSAGVIREGDVRADAAGGDVRQR